MRPSKSGNGVKSGKHRCGWREREKNRRREESAMAVKADDTGHCVSAGLAIAFATAVHVRLKYFRA